MIRRNYKKHPTWDGDIEDYIPDTTLELREPLEDPQYQMTGIYIGDGVVVADRVVLKIPSHEEILQALSSAGTSSGAASTAESERKTPDQVEFQWILKFVAGQEGERYSSYRHQLQSLWTSFCLRYGLDVDTRRYDDMMRRLFRAVGKLFPAEEPFQFEAFDLFMGEHLS